MLQITPTLAIHPAELQEAFTRSPGPGGQNVNKVATAVELRFDLRRSRSLPDGVRSRLAVLAGRRLTADGVIVIRAARFRSQHRNREDARRRLVELIRQALEPRTPRKATQPPFASKLRRAEDKQRRSTTKVLRKRVVED
jgi:ribosome-associated protein